MNNDKFPAALVGFSVFGFLALIGGLAFGFHACATAEKATFDPIDQEIDRRTFENSQTYREGLRRDCAELMRSYEQAKTDDERASVLALLRHRVEGAPADAVPADVKTFLANHQK